MYPSPASAYRPQTQQPQFIPQMTNQNSQSPLPPPSSTYPYPQYSNNANTAASTNNIPPPTATYPRPPGQPLPFPQPIPYGMGVSTAGTTNPQMNNINGSFPVNISLVKISFV
jgi:hypothetical protein